MTSRVLLEPVFVLHHHAYQNSSLIVDFFSRQHGRVSAVARSARGPKSRYKGYCQLFTPLLASWSGRHELMNLNHLELRGLPCQLSGQALLCAFYLNELLLRLLARDDPYPEIFADYQAALQGLEIESNVAMVLRRFEKRLLDHLGYGLNFQVSAHEYYRWLPDQGFLHCEHSTDVGESVFSGRSLIALQTEEWEHPEDLAAAKRLMRLALRQHLGAKPLKSRELML
jgi:DNA repair protein RecO (recombination protein O)